jgi:1-acyl-sn-glycerol-3-phosphate acyltransferase
MRIVVDAARTGITLFAGMMATLLIGSAVIVVAHVRPSSPFVETLARWWSRWWLVAGGVSLNVRGRELVDTDRSYVVVANHRSDFDIMACFLAIPLPIRYLAKKELFRVPVLASAMRSIGIIEIDREAHGTIHDQTNRQARALVAAGRSLIIYPEGTRSRDGSMRPFKKGAFTMAIASGLPVLPVTIHGSRETWPPVRLVRGGTITVLIDSPIETEDMGHADIEPLRSRVQALIEERLELLGAETPVPQS